MYLHNLHSPTFRQEISDEKTYFYLQLLAINIYEVINCVICGSAHHHLLHLIYCHVIHD
jgi:hypothetical protein